MRFTIGAVWPTLVGAFWGNVIANLPFLIVRNHFGLPDLLVEWVIPLAATAAGGTWAICCGSGATGLPAR